VQDRHNISPYCKFSAPLAGPPRRSPLKCETRCQGQTPIRPCSKFQTNQFVMMLSSNWHVTFSRYLPLNGQNLGPKFDILGIPCGYRRQKGRLSVRGRYVPSWKFTPISATVADISVTAWTEKKTTKRAYTNVWRVKNRSAVKYMSSALSFAGGRSANNSNNININVR